jgi:hypothetical protein
MGRRKQKPLGTRGPSKRKVATHVTSSKLWLVDLEIFDNERTRMRISSALLLRKIVHSWAVTKRLSGELTGVIEGIVGQTQERIVAEHVAPLRESVSLILKQLSDLSIGGPVTGANGERPHSAKAPIQQADLPRVATINPRFEWVTDSPMRKSSGRVTTAPVITPHHLAGHRNPDRVHTRR